MTATFRAGLVALLGLGLLAPAAVAVGSAAPAKGQMRVQDDGQVFSPDSVTKAEAKFNGVTFRAPTHMSVRTFATVPANRKSDYDKVKDDKSGKKRQFVRDWAKEMAAAEGEKGVFVLICTESRSIEVLADRQTDLAKHFPDSDADKVYEALKGAFESAAAAKDKSEDEKRAIRGDGLVRAADIVIGQLRNETAPAEKSAQQHTGGVAGAEHKKGEVHWWQWALIIVGILLFIWIVVALIRR